MKAWVRVVMAAASSASAGTACIDTKGGTNATNLDAATPPGLVGVTARDSDGAIMFVPTYATPGIRPVGELVITGPNYVATFTDGADSTIPRIRSLVYQGEELLFTNEGNECHLEDGIGMAMYPGWSTSAAGARYSNIQVYGNGGASFDVSTDWSAEVPCEAADSAALIGGTSFYRFLPDGRIIQRDTLSVADAAAPDNAAFTCEPAPTCGLAETSTIALTSFVALDASMFHQIAFTPNQGQLSPQPIDEVVALHRTYDDAMGLEQGWLCAFNAEQPGPRVGMTWLSGDYDNGQGARVSEFLDPDAGQIGAVAFEWDWFTSDGTVGIPAYNNFVGPPPASSYAATHALHLGLSSDPACAEMAVAAAREQAPTTIIANGTSDNSPLLYAGNLGGYTWVANVASGDQAILRVASNLTVPPGTLVQVEFGNTSDQGIDVYEDAAIDGAAPPVRLVEGVDYLVAGPIPGANVKVPSVIYGVYLAAGIAADHAVVIQAMGMAPPANL